MGLAKAVRSDWILSEQPSVQSPATPRLYRGLFQRAIPLGRSTPGSHPAPNKPDCAHSRRWLHPRCHTRSHTRSHTSQYLHLSHRLIGGLGPVGHRPAGLVACLSLLPKAPCCAIEACFGFAYRLTARLTFTSPSESPHGDSCQFEGCLVSEAWGLRAVRQPVNGSERDGTPLPFACPA